MRVQFLVGGVVSLGILVVLAACSTDVVSVAPGPGDDAGSSGSSGTSSGDPDPEETDGGTDGGTKPSYPKLKSDTLATGNTQLSGIAGDDAIFVDVTTAGAFTLNAVPIAGGAVTKIADFAATDALKLSGGAVGFWSGVTAVGTQKTGSFSVWTRATGLKAAINATSVAGMFWASTDGTRIAFSQNAKANVGATALDTTEIGIRDTGAATNSAELKSAGTAILDNLVNMPAVVSKTCGVSMRFVGKVFLAAFCNGVDPAAVNAKVMMVPSAGLITPSRLDGVAAAPLNSRPFFSADTTVTKVLIINTNKQAKFVTVGAGGSNLTTITGETTTEDGLVLPDGTAAILKNTANVVKKATTAATPVVTTVVADVKGFLAFAKDNKQILFNKLDESNEGLVDMNLVDHSVAPPAPVVIEATQTTIPMGFNDDATHVFFAANLAAGGGALKAFPVAGGAAKAVVTTGVLGGRPVGEGGGVLFLTDPAKVGSTVVSSVNYVDAVAAGKPSLINDSIPASGGIQVVGKRVIYRRFAPSGGGLFAVTLP